MLFQTRFNLTLFTRNFVSSASYLHLEVYHEEHWLGALKAEMAEKWRHEKPPPLSQSGIYTAASADGKRKTVRDGDKFHLKFM